MDKDRLGRPMIAQTDREHYPILSSTVLEIRAWHESGTLHFVCQWNGAELERCRKEVGEETLARQLRTNGKWVVESIEDALARRDHPPGPCLPGCPHHGKAATPDSV